MLWAAVPAPDGYGYAALVCRCCGWSIDVGSGLLGELNAHVEACPQVGVVVGRGG